MKEILLKLAIIFGISLLVVFFVNSMYLKKYKLEYHYPHNLINSPAIADPYRLVKVGNSHSQSGITFKKYTIKSLDLSSVAQRFETDLALLKQNQNQIADGAIIIIDVSQISFSHTNYNTTKGFQSGYYGRVSPFYIPNLNWGDFIESEFFSFARVGYFWRKNYATDVRDVMSAEEKAEFEKNLGLVPTPTPVPNKGPKVPPTGPILNVEPENVPFNVQAIQADLAKPTKLGNKFDDSVNFIVNKWYHTDEFDTNYFSTNRHDLEKMIAFCLEHNWKPVLITIPITEELEAKLDADYKEKYIYNNLAQTNTQGVEYIDFSDDARIASNNIWFGNSDHLNQEGAAAFSYVLLQTLIEKGYLTKEVDGYDYRPLYVEVEK